MKRTIVVAALLICASAALAQQAPQPDPAKLVPWLQQQRNAALDGAAQCYVTATDLQNRIAELEKEIAAAKATPLPKETSKPDASPASKSP